VLPKELDITQVSDSQKAFTKLLNGEVDYIFGNPYSIEAEARRYKLNTKIKIVPISLINQELFAIFSSRSRCQNLYKILANRFQKKRDNIKEEQQKLKKYVDDWGQRFKNDLGLEEILKEEFKKVQAETLESSSDFQKTENKSGI
jgi:ABC-type amino acid transport substrate-binding protein